jgi:hypothetical protein
MSVETARLNGTGDPLRLVSHRLSSFRERRRTGARIRRTHEHRCLGFALCSVPQGEIHPRAHGVSQKVRPEDRGFDLGRMCCFVRRDSGSALHGKAVGLFVVSTVPFP